MLAETRQLSAGMYGNSSRTNVSRSAPTIPLFNEGNPLFLHFDKNQYMWKSQPSRNQVATKSTKSQFEKKMFHINREYIMKFFMLLVIMATFVQVNAQTGGKTDDVTDGKRIAHYVVQQCSTLFLIFLFNFFYFIDTYMSFFFFNRYYYCSQRHDSSARSQRANQRYHWRCWWW